MSLVCVGVCAAAEGDAPLACNIKAISAAQRPRYNDLVKRLRIAVMNRSELSDGYAYKLDTKEITLPEASMPCFKPKSKARKSPIRLCTHYEP